MYFNKISEIFKYPHFKSVLRHYLWRHPSLCLAGHGLFSNYYFSKKLNDIMNDDLISSLHYFLPTEFVDYLDENGFKEFDGFRLLLYALVKKIKPEIVIETGVYSGASSAFILLALHQNKKGKLYSIDLSPNQLKHEIKKHSNNLAYTLEDGAKYYNDREVGYLVPNYLRSRWNLILGDSKDELPVLLGKKGKCDIFFS